MLNVEIHANTRHRMGHIRLWCSFSEPSSVWQITGSYTSAWISFKFRYEYNIRAMSILPKYCACSAAKNLAIEYEDGSQITVSFLFIFVSTYYIEQLYYIIFYFLLYFYSLRCF